jgi:hypothetical protein
MEKEHDIAIYARAFYHVKNKSALIEHLQKLSHNYHALIEFSKNENLLHDDIDMLRKKIIDITERIKMSLYNLISEAGEAIPLFIAQDLNRVVRCFNISREQYKGLTFSFTDDLKWLFVMGKSSTIMSCQSYDYVGSSKIGLLGAIANPWVKMFMIRDNNEILARAKAYLLKDHNNNGNNYYVVVDRFYGDPKLLPILKKKIEEILESWHKEGLIKSYYLESRGQGKPVGPFIAPVYSDVFIGIEKDNDYI